MGKPATTWWGRGGVESTKLGYTEGEPDVYLIQELSQDYGNLKESQNQGIKVHTGYQ